MTNDTFTARTPDGRRVTCRVKRDGSVYDEPWYKEQARIAKEQNARLWDKTDGPRSFNDIMKANAGEVTHAPPLDPVITDVVDRHHGRGVEFDLADGTHMTFRSEGALARWLAVQERINKSEELSMQHDSWQKIAADHGVLAIAKMVTDESVAPGSLDEHTFTKLLTEHAQRAYPGLSPAAAFEKLFTAQTEDAKLLRQAHLLTKAWPAPVSIEPMVSGGSDAFPTVTMRPGSSAGRKTDPADGLGTAYEQLTRLAEQQRRHGETSSAAFARVYSENPRLAELERIQNRPGAAGVRVTG
jgi:hypothetical protein